MAFLALGTTTAYDAALDVYQNGGNSGSYAQFTINQYHAAISSGW